MYRPRVYNLLHRLSGFQSGAGSLFSADTIVTKQVHPLIQKCCNSPLHRTYSQKSVKGEKSSFLDNLWDEDQTKMILDGMNYTPLEDLQSLYKISSRMSQRIVDSRPFNSIGQIMEMPRINVVNLEGLCRKFIRKVRAPTKSRSDKGLTPALTPDTSGSIKTIVSIDFGHNWFQWLSMTDDFTFKDNSFVPSLLGESPTHQDITKRLTEVIDRIPKADVYLLQLPYYLRGAGSKVLKRSRNIDATFCGIMSSRMDVSNIYTIKQLSVFEEFGMVMTEGRINGPFSIVDQIIETSSWKCHEIKNLRHYVVNFRSYRKVDNDLRICGDILLLTNMYFNDQILLPSRE